MIVIVQIVHAVHAFFYKNKLYKNTEVKICPKIKEQAKNNHQAEILIRKIWEIYLQAKTKLVRI